MPLLPHKQSRCALTLTAIKLTETNEDFGVLYEPLEGIERFENYGPGGYHPIQIGDHFHGRYRVVHKLGHGSYSTAWLARDEQCNKYVAVKICIANANSKEADMISTLTRPHCLPVNHPGKKMVPSILDRFTIHGPNGNHSCYVTALASASLSGVKDGSYIRLFQPDVARSLAAQLVLAVDYIHAQGMVHGDLHLGNILLKVPPNFDQLSLEQLYEKYGAPQLDPVVRLDGNPLPPGVPSHGIVPIWLGKASEKITLSDTRVLLTDFGEAFFPSEEPKHESRTPLVIRPPEVRFEPNDPLSFPSDIWTLACSIWDIVSQRPIFEWWFVTEDYITREHVDILGVLPPEWWRRWEARTLDFTENGEPANRQDGAFHSLDDRFDYSVQKPRRDRGIPPFDAREREAFFDMLRPMLSFRPEDRPTTKQILDSEWMRKWALPEYGKIQDNV
ncbi:kinase-like protein [Penicillium bovifimosum]|uniref:non-specific serine/threonine protein kinase n=1 Tax=Penicillium bovifimosum TaxID=126998 RepID=A0A9W9H9P6_9EURO|nr:kinase-like protein [Penicillium bovifimosum]KAJ5142661.1 kinase-like protein [Penicillium bovifimosum]